MKTFLISLLALTSIATINVYAAESVDLTVTGSINVGACDLNLSSPVVDFGNINIKSMTDGVFIPPQKRTILTVSCSEAIAAQLIMTDNRSDSIDLDNNGQPATDIGAGFGLGFTDSTRTVAIGYMHIGMGVDADTGADLGTTIDTQPGMVIFQDNGIWQTDSPIRGNANVRFAWQPKGQSTFSPGTFNTVVMPLSIWLHINSADVLKLKNEAKIDGSLTLSLVYP